MNSQSDRQKHQDLEFDKLRTPNSFSAAFVIDHAFDGQTRRFEWQSSIRWVLLIVLALVSCPDITAKQESNSRRPTNEDEAKFWLENMIWHHDFSHHEIHRATGWTFDEIDRLKESFQISRETRPAVAQHELLVVPYPGGRHPRIGFLEGAIAPQRETKLSIFTPWDRDSYVVADVPEAIWSNLGLTYLAHTHIDTIWTSDGIELEQMEWNRSQDNVFRLSRTLPNGIKFDTTATAGVNAVQFSMNLTNGTDQLLTDLRVQNCIMLKGAVGFEEQSNDNKRFVGKYAAAHDPTGTKWIISAWSPLHRCWANTRCPCLHSDPVFDDCSPGETVSIQGWLSFYEGEDIEAEIERIEATGWFEVPRIESINDNCSNETEDEVDETQWIDARELTIEGQAWSDVESPYDRFPARAESTVREAVWNLSRHSAGICIRFETDASAIHADWQLTSSSLAMPHMPATGVSGLDLYVKIDDEQYRWLANGRPSGQSNNVQLVSGLSNVRREYMLYLPLYNGVTEVKLGFDDATVIQSGSDRPTSVKPIVFYGTSITQGGCASRPGMVHTAILGRRLDYPIINLGFSGNGRMEVEVADLIAEIDASLYVIDCLPNMNADMVHARTAELVHRLREERPTTPILLVEDRSYSGSHTILSQARRNQSNREALREQYDELVASGVERLYYLSGKDLLGMDADDTVDGSHPTDLGFYRQANAFEPILKEILQLDD